MSTERQELIYPEEAESRLDVFLACELDLSRSQAARLIDEGAVTADKGKVKASRVCRPGDRFCVQVPLLGPERLIPQDVPFEVLYEDQDCAVIEKPAGLTVHPGAGQRDGTLANGLLARFPSLAAFGDTLRPGIVHRLDKGTSGLMVVALTPKAALALAKQFSNRQTEKEYLALAHGTLASDGGAVDLPIARSRTSRVKMAARLDGREARTEYEVLWRRPGWVMVSCHIATGRTHQIRVHLSALGLYLDGDRLYGPADDRAHRLRDRVFLHAHRLGFFHPRGGQWMRFESPLPPELRELAQKIQETPEE